MFFSFSQICYCDIKAKSEDPVSGGSGCGHLANDQPKNRCRFGVSNNPGNQSCSYYFGDTLQHLPQRTEENKDSCFVSHCQNGQQPSGFNMNGETECACPAGEGVLDDGKLRRLPRWRGNRRQWKLQTPAPPDRASLPMEVAAPAPADKESLPTEFAAPVLPDNSLILRVFAPTTWKQAVQPPERAFTMPATMRGGAPQSPRIYFATSIRAMRRMGRKKSRCLAPGQDQSSTTPHCSEIFGPYSQDRVRDNNYFPQKPADGSKPHYVYNCDPDGTSGMIPATINTIGATECACPAGQGVRDNGNCGACPGGEAIDANGNCNACSSGEEVVGGFCVPTAIKVGAQNCLAASRKFSAADGGSCAVAVTLSGGTLYGKCRLSGPGSPQCADVFGAGLDFPSVSIDGPFIYDCDPTGSKGLIPATTNTIAATECSCPAGMREHNGMCVEADRCFYEDIDHHFPQNAMSRSVVDQQIENCNAKGWGAKRNPFYDSSRPSSQTCYCDIKAHGYTNNNGGCGMPRRYINVPDTYCQIGPANSNLFCRHYFGDTLQHLPQKTEENKDSCFASHCPGGSEPSGVNMNGETECSCPAGKELEGGVCTCTSGASLPDGSCVVTCPAGQFLRDGECACPAGQILQDGACVACPLEQAAFHGRCIAGKHPFAGIESL